MEQFNLFELEKINFKDLLSVHPRIQGKDEYEIRAKIALTLKDEGKLKDCPLFSKYQKDVEIFYKILSTPPNPKYEKYLSNYNFGLQGLSLEYRMLYVYLMFTLEMTNGENSTLFDHFVKYDESYFEAINNLTFSALLDISNLFETLDINAETSYHITKRLAQLIYYKLKSGLIKTEDYTSLSKLSAYLQVLARENNDLEFELTFGSYTEYRGRQENDFEEYDSYETIDEYNFTLFTLVPSIENIPDIDPNINLEKFVNISLSSVMGYNPCSHINFEIFVDIIQYLYDTLNYDCTKFFNRFTKSIPNDKALRYFTAAVFNRA